MPTLYHPSLTGITRDVDKSDVDKWTAAGWRKTEPKRLAEARKADESTPDAEAPSK